MYAIYAYIGVVSEVNVGKYAIHGVFGYHTYYRTALAKKQRPMLRHVSTESVQSSHMFHRLLGLPKDVIRRLDHLDIETRI